MTNDKIEFTTLGSLILARGFSSIGAPVGRDRIDGARSPQSATGKPYFPPPLKSCYLISFIIIGSVMARMSNRQVVRELKEGDRLGCRHLIELYQNLLIHEATHTFHVPALDAEEIVNDVLLAVINGIDKFEFKKADADFHHWVMAICRNRVRDFMRHIALTKELFESYEESFLETEERFSPAERGVLDFVLRGYRESIYATTMDDPDDESQQAPNRLQLVADSLDEMETWERVLLRSRALDVPYEDIARYTGKTAKQLKVYHGRVRRKFMNLLVKRYPEYFKL